jgi:diazepam-binding inhibitor (GABA receptor modulating acyl-CoA-binding protein)
MTFEEAADAVTKLSARPDNDTLLKLYALFKQGSVGDVSGKRPGMIDFKGRAKFDAWAKLQGVTSDDAKSQYVQLVESLVSADQ